MATDVIEAKETQVALMVASFPSMKKHARIKQQRQLAALARVHTVSGGPAMSMEEFAATLGGALNG